MIPRKYISAFLLIPLCVQNVYPGCIKLQKAGKDKKEKQTANKSDNSKAGGNPVD